MLAFSGKQNILDKLKNYKAFKTACIKLQIINTQSIQTRFFRLNHPSRISSVSEKDTRSSLKLSMGINLIIVAKS